MKGFESLGRAQWDLYHSKTFTSCAATRNKNYQASETVVSKLNLKKYLQQTF